MAVQAYRVAVKIMKKGYALKRHALKRAARLVMMRRVSRYSTAQDKL